MFGNHGATIKKTVIVVITVLFSVLILLSLLFSENTTTKSASTRTKSTIESSPNVQTNVKQTHLSSRNRKDSSIQKFRNMRFGQTDDSSLSPSEMLAKFSQAKQDLLNRLAVDYGQDNVYNIFFSKKANNEQISRGRTAFLPPTDSGLSRQRLMRKILVKLLRRMTGKGSNNSDAEGTTFVWATGGHSAAASHGNKFETDSYTAVMERAAQPIFQAVGIDFIGRNYAMGGTSSYPEMAACSAEVYGFDIDILSWDFGMTDGARNPEGMATYCGHAAARLPRQPACIGLHVGDKYKSFGEEYELEHGMSIFYMDDDEQAEITKAIPETFGLTSEQIESMPKYVKSFKCNNQLEHGDPTCGDDKFDRSYCPDRKYRVSWHPGWKVGALEGNMLAFFMIDLLEDALQELTKSNESAQSMLTRLQTLDAEDRQLVMNAEFKNEAFDFLKKIADDIDHNMILRQPGYCHTGRLPAEIRYKGILTETTNGDGRNVFDEGIYQREADAIPDESNLLMRLVKDNDSRQDCNVTLEIDYKDYFYVNYNDGVKKLILPNNMEKAYYGTNEPLKGYLAICMTVCDWGNCPSEHIAAEDLVNGKASMFVNGVAVTNVTFFQNCRFMKHDKGHRFPVNDDGRLEIVTHVREERHYLRIGTFLVW